MPLRGLEDPRADRHLSIDPRVKPDASLRQDSPPRQRRIAANSGQRSRPRGRPSLTVQTPILHTCSRLTPVIRTQRARRLVGRRRGPYSRPGRPPCGLPCVHHGVLDGSAVSMVVGAADDSPEPLGVTSGLWCSEALARFRKRRLRLADATAQSSATDMRHGRSRRSCRMGPPARLPRNDRYPGVTSRSLPAARRWTCPSCTSLTHSQPGLGDSTRGSLGAWPSRRARTYARSCSIRART